MKSVLIALVLFAAVAYATEEATARPWTVDGMPWIKLNSEDKKAAMATGVLSENFRNRGFTVTKVDDIETKKMGVFEVFRLTFVAHKDNEIVSINNLILIV